MRQAFLTASRVYLLRSEHRGHLLCGADPAYVGEMVFTEKPCISALRLALRPRQRGVRNRAPTRARG